MTSSSLESMSTFSQALKPQDSFGESNNIFLDLQKVQEIIRKHRQTFPQCFEWHIVMQHCPVANYHYVHNLWQRLRTFLCFGYFLKMEAFRSELLTGH